MAAALRQDALQTGVSLQKITPIKGKWRVQWVQHPGSVHCEDFENLIITIPAHRIPQLPLPLSDPGLDELLCCHTAPNSYGEQL